MATPDTPGPAGIHLPAFLLYNGLIVPPAVAGFHLARFTSEKVRTGVEGRQGVWERFRAARRSLAGAVWVHATSVGEYEQARPLLRALRQELEAAGVDVPLLVTLFSPSGYGYAHGRFEADHVDYLPLDTAPAAWRLMRWIRPRVLVFVKYDCWPNLVWAARRAHVPTFLLDASLQRRSLRLRRGLRWFFRRLFDSFTAIGAISMEDARRFRGELGVRCPVAVTGDTRADQVIHRWQSAGDHPLVRQLQSQPYRYITLGSLWPQDEAAVLAPTLDWISQRPQWGAVLVPHEPTPRHLSALESELAARGLAAARLSELMEPKTFARRSTAAARDRARWRFIVVDSVGVLAEIYRASDLAYVGGGFSTGVHSVLEPAVAGQPVLFGPRVENAYEAERLVEIGAARTIGSQADMAQLLPALLDDEETRAAAGAKAQRWVRAQRGATASNLALLAAQLGLRTPPR